MRFYEQYKHAGFPCVPETSYGHERADAFARRFSSKSKGGVLNEWPSEVIEEMTLGLIARLASQTRKHPKPLLLEIAAGVWDAVRAKE